MRFGSKKQQSYIMMRYRVYRSHDPPIKGGFFIDTRNQQVSKGIVKDLNKMEKRNKDWVWAEIKPYRTKA